MPDNDVISKIFTGESESSFPHILVDDDGMVYFIHFFPNPLTIEKIFRVEKFTCTTEEEGGRKLLCFACCYHLHASERKSIKKNGNFLSFSMKPFENCLHAYNLSSRMNHKSRQKLRTKPHLSHITTMCKFPFSLRCCRHHHHLHLLMLFISHTLKNFLAFTHCCYSIHTYTSICAIFYLGVECHDEGKELVNRSSSKRKEEYNYTKRMKHKRATQQGNIISTNYTEIAREY